MPRPSHSHFNDHHCRQDLPILSGNAGPWKGDLTWYDVGLGACGTWTQNSDLVCAVSHVIYDAAALSTNPNDNPLCKLRLRLWHDGKSVDVQVVDRCDGCETTDIDVSPGAFQELANLEKGRVPLTWQLISDSSEAVNSGSCH